MRCHGGAKKKKGLDLRTEASALRGGDSGPIIAPGEPDKSRLYRLVLPGADPHMPSGKKQLSGEDLALIRAWIVQLAGGAPGNPTIGVPGVRTPSELSDFTPPDGARPRTVINLMIELGWQSRAVAPSGICDDRSFARRVSLDLIGRIPSFSELENFLANTDSRKRERLVDRLLVSDEHARYFREIFDVVLLGRRGGGVEARRKSAKWFEYLERIFRENRPWNEVVEELLVARPETAENRGAVWFLYEQKDNHQKIAEALAPALIGIQVQCAQCHDHPIAPEIEQRHYWGLVSFFSRSKNTSGPMGPALAESAIGGHGKFADLQGENHAALPVFFDGQAIDETRPAEGVKETDDPARYLVPPSKGKVSVPRASRRAELAHFVNGGEHMPRAFVNRIWALLVGRGFVHPVDKMNSAHRPSHPRLLSWLARDFRLSGFDVRRLLREIVLSRVYMLARSSPEETAAPPEAFARAFVKPLLAEALMRSTLVALGVPVEKWKELGSLRQEIIRLFPDLLAEVHSPTLHQALFYTNSPLFDQLLEPAGDNLTARILSLSSDEDRVRLAFSQIFGRAPDAEELERGSTHLKRREGRLPAAVKQLVWALLASSEFRLNS